MRRGQNRFHLVPDYLSVVHENQVRSCEFSVCGQAGDEFSSTNRRPKQNSTTEPDIFITTRFAL